MGKDYNGFSNLRVQHGFHPVRLAQLFHAAAKGVASSRAVSLKIDDNRLHTLLKNSLLGGAALSEPLGNHRLNRGRLVALDSMDVHRRRRIIIGSAIGDRGVVVQR
jgi:hypothetical protein